MIKKLIFFFFVNFQKLTEDTQESKTSAKGSISKMQFRNNDDDVVLTLGKKEFSHYKHQNVFIENEGQWVSAK